jgi:hypothetical protein
MKNRIACAVAATLCLTMAMPAYAADGVTAGDVTVTAPAQKELDVTAKVDASMLVHADDVHSVEISWDSLEFSYAFNNEDTTTWDPETHTYISTEDYPFNVPGTWLRREAGNEYSRTNSDVVVTNHSNSDVTVSAVFKDSKTPLSQTVDNVTATLSNASFALVTGEGRTYNEADSSKFTVTVDGDPNVTEDFKIGTVAISIASKN